MHWRVKFYLESVWRARIYTAPMIVVSLGLLIAVLWPLDARVPNWLQVVITLALITMAFALCSPDLVVCDN